MRTYVINLKDSEHRKRYMENLLYPYRESLDVIFKEAFDGRKLSDSELDLIFNQQSAYTSYGRKLKGGEVGCTLSHRACYESIVSNEEKYALILEDDLVLTVKDINEVIDISAKLLNTEVPVVVLLSGDYWYYYKKRVSDKYCVANVCEAVCTQAYFINNSAARCILSKDKSYLADDWYAIRKQGVKLFAIYPHVADQERVTFVTEISEEYSGVNRKMMPLGGMIRSYIRAFVKRFLLLCGNFESKSF